MRRFKLNSERFRWTSVMKCTAAAILLAGCLAVRSVAQQEGQKTFSSAEEASQALIAALQSNDEKAMLDVLGPLGREIVSSGDDAEDAETHANFVQRYQQMHRLMKEPDGTVTLYIGPENWPAPVPIVNKGNIWYFDTAAGKQEILYRRVGRNELSTIQVCEELVAAEKEYRSAQHDAYAQKIISTEGQHDGLYWKADDGQPPSPIGPLVAMAFVTDSANSKPMPFHGYYFRLLTHQEKSGKAGGFAFVAYPVEYRSSGVMTFLVKEDGTVYEKDLGKDTEATAKAITDRASHSGWHKSETPQEEFSAQQKTP